MSFPPFVSSAFNHNRISKECGGGRVKDAARVPLSSSSYFRLLAGQARPGQLAAWLIARAVIQLTARAFPPCGAPKCTPGLYRAESVPTGSSNLFIVAAARSSIDASSWIRAVFRTPPSSSSSRRALFPSLCFFAMDNS